MGGRREDTQDVVLGEVFRAASAVGDVPAVILGDFNSEPDEVAVTALADGRWGVLPQSTARGTINSSEKRLDFCIASRVYATLASAETVR